MESKHIWRRDKAQFQFIKRIYRIVIVLHPFPTFEALGFGTYLIERNSLSSNRQSIRLSSSISQQIISKMSNHDFGFINEVHLLTMTCYLGAQMLKHMNILKY